MELSVRTFPFISAQMATYSRAEPHWRSKCLQQGKLGHDWFLVMQLLLTFAKHVGDHAHINVIFLHKHSAMEFNLK